MSYKYKLITYSDGGVVGTYGLYNFQRALELGAYDLVNGASVDQYEITNERGDVVAYAYTEDSPKAKEKEADYNADRREVRADIARDIQRDELANRAHCGAGKS